MAGASAVQAAKRALVVVLRSLAAVYSIMLEVNRDSPDDEVKKAFKRVAAKAHPDKGGATEDSQRLNAVRDAWLHAQKNTRQTGRPGRAASASESGTRATPTTSASGGAQKATCTGLLACNGVRREYRIQGEGILLTYQGLPASGRQ